MDLLDVRPAVAAALREGRPVVALESTLIAHGLPWPVNLQTARDAEQAVLNAGAVPATIAVVAGRPTVGLVEGEIEHLARPGQRVRKASTRDLAAAVALAETAATTVAATMLLARHAGIAVFATGGIGGVHPAVEGRSWDVSADLVQLVQTPVCVVCSGAKSILDLPSTLEYLETFSVPVVGYGVDTFPAFYTVSSGLPVSARTDDPRTAARLLKTHWQLCQTGLVLAQPVPAAAAMSDQEMRPALRLAEDLARVRGVSGPALTPFLLARLAEITDGKTLKANQALIVANARLAAEVAVAFQKA